MPQKPSLRLRLASAILGGRAKEFIPSLGMYDRWSSDGTGRLKNFATKDEQLSANIGWCFTANTSIVDPCSAVELKLYRKKKDGDREEIKEHELLDLLDTPNLAHTGEQMRQLHETYMNFVGESYLYMVKGGSAFIPTKGKLPDALQVLPAHLVQFKLGSTYSKSIVKLGQDEYPLVSTIRDLNPDPGNPYYGRSLIAASAAVVDMDEQMKEWNRRLFANNARPSLIFNTNEPLTDEAYERWKQQFSDEHTGAENAYKPLLIEGGDAKPYMMSQQDLDFLESRKFSRDEILAMWRVNPYTIGSVENVNLATARAARIQHAEINVEPRLRRFVRQLNSSLVSVYDPTLELGFENPVPEDIDAKLAEAKAGVNLWRTINETRNMYGEDALPDGLGDQLYLQANLAPIAAVADGSARPAPVMPGNPNMTPNPDDPQGGDIGTKALEGVKKNS